MTTKNDCRLGSAPYDPSKIQKEVRRVVRTGVLSGPDSRASPARGAGEGGEGGVGGADPEPDLYTPAPTANPVIARSAFSRQ